MERVHSEKVLSLIQEDELVELALALGNIDSVQPYEERASRYVFEWLERHGFRPRRIGLPDRYNVLGRLRGLGSGYSLIFNSHLDTERVEASRLRNPDHRAYHSAWRSGDRLVGYGIVNDRGPMAAFMIAAKAIKEAGVQLKGDVLLSMVVGETGGSPVDEFQGPQYDSHELGARYLVTHGGYADFALVAEATGFRIAAAECGFVYMKITVLGGLSHYTPQLPPRDLARPESSPNAIVRMAKLIQLVERYAAEYEARNKRKTAHGGIQTGKAQIGAVRAGSPYYPAQSPELASMYLDFRTLPGADPLSIKADLEQLMSKAGLEGDVEIYKVLPGFEAENIERLVDSLRWGHMEVFEAELTTAPTLFHSMWRDINVFNELGIPSVSYAFATAYTDSEYVPSGDATVDSFSASVRDLVASAKVYALTALHLCNQEKEERALVASGPRQAISPHQQSDENR